MKEDFYICLKMSIIKVKTFRAFIAFFKVLSALRSPVASYPWGETER